MAGLSGRLRDWNHWRMAAGESGHWPLSPASAEASKRNQRRRDRERGFHYSLVCGTLTR
jgi:hypothetical protein